MSGYEWISMEIDGHPSMDTNGYSWMSMTSKESMESMNINDIHRLMIMEIHES
jgi:hypothetical protein